MRAMDQLLITILKNRTPTETWHLNEIGNAAKKNYITRIRVCVCVKFMIY